MCFSTIVFFETVLMGVINQMKNVLHSRMRLVYVNHEESGRTYVAEGHCQPRMGLWSRRRRLMCKNILSCVFLRERCIFSLRLCFFEREMYIFSTIVFFWERDVYFLYDCVFLKQFYCCNVWMSCISLVYVNH